MTDDSPHAACRLPVLPVQFTRNAFSSVRNQMNQYQSLNHHSVAVLLFAIYCPARRGER